VIKQKSHWAWASAHMFLLLSHVLQYWIFSIKFIMPNTCQSITPFDLLKCLSIALFHEHKCIFLNILFNKLMLSEGVIISSFQILVLFFLVYHNWLESMSKILKVMFD
jgi:hypothetical protein